ncbi:MAG: hypothetical protein WC558_11880 [Patulibacter sp.]
MPVAGLLADLVTVVCVGIVLGMGGLLIARGTRKRPEDHDEDHEDELPRLR